jgi:CHAT domain-containing protein
MQHFYSYLAENPERDQHAALLSNAQRHLMSDSATEHPYFWAPFVLVGDSNNPTPEVSDSEV